MNDKYLLFLLFSWLVFASFWDFDPAFRWLRKVNLFLSSVLFILISGFRVDVPDLATYKLIFEDIGMGRETDRSNGMELLYWQLNWIFFQIFGDSGFRVLIIFVAAITFFINFHVIRQISPYPFISLAFYAAGPFWGKDLTQLRAGLAAALIMLAFYFLVLERKRLRHLLTLTLASMTHVSAVVAFLPTAFIRIVGFWILVLAMVSFFILMSVDFKTSTFFIDTTPFKLPPIIEQYRNISTQSGSIDIFSPRLLSQTAVFGFLFFHRRALFSLFPHARTFLYVYGVSLVLFLFFYDFLILGTRLSSILSNVEMILIAFIPSVGQRVYRLPGVFGALTICFCALTLMSNALSDKLPVYNNLLF